MKNILKGHSNDEDPFFGKKWLKKLVTVVLSLDRSFVPSPWGLSQIH